ncbi:MAG: molybdopterin-dependent oxidoreductase, partial [Deltaproteobacteria bacterium]|nr:molybdopterin-dependent oxidoreductase [Deltaproteobacteria bacterium]
MDSYTYVNTRVRKKDGRDKVTGKAIYCQDLVLPRMLHGKILYSVFPHAKIVSIDVSKARKVPGVRAVLTGEDIPYIPIGFLGDNVPLKRGKVRSPNDEIAAVAAESEEAAQEALELIEVVYEELPAVFDPMEALEPDAPLVHDGRQSNRIDEICRVYRTGDIEKGFGESDLVIEQTYDLQYVSHLCMGASYAAASFDGSGRLTVWSPTQVPFILQRDLAKSLGISGRDVKIVQPTIGGAFGKALDMYPHEVIAVLLARETGRPVRIAFTREEELAVAPKRQPARITLKQGVTRDGKLKARKVDVLLNAGAYVSWGPVSSWTMVQTFGSFYKVPNIEFHATPVYTNGP